MGIAVIDIIFVVIIFIFAVHCTIKGFVREVMSLIAAILGIVTATIFFKATALFLRQTFNWEIKVLPEVLAFAVIFLIVFAFIKLLQLLLKGIIDGVRLGGLDRFLGFFFGCAEGVIVVCLLLFAINIIPFIDSEPILKGSFFAEFLLPFITGTEKMLTDNIIVLMLKGSPSFGGSPSNGGINV